MPTKVLDRLKLFETVQGPFAPPSIIPTHAKPTFVNPPPYFIIFKTKFSRAIKILEIFFFSSDQGESITTFKRKHQQ